MPDTRDPRGLIQRLMERRRAIEQGDPTGRSLVQNASHVRRQTSNRDQRRARIAELEAELKAIRRSPANRFRQADNAARGLNSLVERLAPNIPDLARFRDRPGFDPAPENTGHVNFRDMGRIRNKRGRKGDQ